MRNQTGGKRRERGTHSAETLVSVQQALHSRNKVLSENWGEMGDD